MASSRRPPPPPPKDPSPPPPLPSRNGTNGNRRPMEPLHPTHSLPGVTVSLNKFQGTAPEQDDDDTYEQPTSHSSSDISAAARGEAINYSSKQRIPAAENSDSEGWSESEWDDSTNLDKNKKIEIKSTETSVPKAPPKKTNPGDQYKPVPKPKPLKSSDPTFPKLPPRPKEKPLPTIPSVPPLGPVDITCTGSVSSDCQSNQEKVTEKIAANKHKEVKSLPSVTDTPIYHDGISEVLSRFDWFHGELEREEGAKRVKQLSENGTFLIRASKTDDTNNSHPYTLVVILDNKVYNLKIRLRPDTRFAIGNYKPEEVSFSTVPELVEHHKENNIKLSEGGSVKLTNTPKK